MNQLSNPETGLAGQDAGTQNLIDIKRLTIHYETNDGVVEAVNDVSLSVRKGETFGLVGETGAGKTSIALAIIGLLPFPPTNIISGEIIFQGEELLKKSKIEMRQYRGKRISMIFQDPMSALNPVLFVGDQIAEVIRLHQRISRQEAVEKAKEMLSFVGIRPERYKEYPHQFSGGMKQRVVIAIALACNPELIIADEPTTALDVTIQAQILEFMKELTQDKDTSMLLITHDFGIVAETCERCAVVYAGEIVEIGTVEQIFDNPLHPYTIGLFNSLPSLEMDVERLQPIPGIVANPMDLPPWCSFYDRCDKKSDACRNGNPQLTLVEPEHYVRCFATAAKEESNGIA